MKAIIFDIDGTLADCNHRRHHIRNGNRDWNAFFATMHLDPVIESIATLSRIVANEVSVICCSGRGEEYREVTETWLENANVPYIELFMRPAGDKRADHVVKLELLEEIRRRGYEPILVVDDRASVVSMWRQNGLTCLQCSDWDESKAQAGTNLNIMVGPSGAGKSSIIDTWIGWSEENALGIFMEKYGKITKASVISSDGIRQELCGDFRDQSRNDDVFHAMHTLAKTRLSLGLSVVLDATNIRTKDRVAAAKIGLPNATVRYFVLNRAMPDKLASAGWRKDVMIGNLSLIEKHEQVFNANLKEILKGDGLPVEVIDWRHNHATDNAKKELDKA